MWVLNGTSDRSRGTRIAGFLDYHGLAASAPRQRPSGAVPADTTIVVYNGAETKYPATIAYLEKTLGRDRHDRDRSRHPDRHHRHGREGDTRSRGAAAVLTAATRSG